jgi:predicted RecB family nuclease
MSAVPPDARVQRTLEAVRNRVAVVYQGELASEATLDGTSVTVIGRPDFLIWDGDGYALLEFSTRVNFVLR